MRFIVILLVSVIGHSLAQILQVKCGDETCERPSNRAVTTLRYTPDKPYKLQINAVNSEVEIFGATDDLFYIRYGRNYGFLPKNHLREKARGNFPHTVEINLGSLQVNQEVRETNFLHEFLKSSQSAKVEKDVSNETVSDQPNTEEKVVTERPTEYIPTGIEPNIQELPTNSSNEIEKKDESLNSENEDSGLEEEDGEDYESESGDDEGEDDEDEEFLDSDKKPSDSVSEDLKLPSESEEKVEVKPASLETPEDIVNITETATPEVPIETVTQPIQAEVPIESPEVQTEIVKNEEVLVKNEDIPETTSELVNGTVDSMSQNDTNNSVEKIKVDSEEIKIESEPAPVTEELNEELPKENPQLIPDATEIPPFDPSLPPEIRTEEPILVAPETTTIPMEIVTETPNIEETTQTPPKVEETTQAPPKVEETTQTPPKVEETPQTPPKVEETPQVVEEIKQTLPTPPGDMLLRRFDEKLSHKMHDHEGVGSVEQVPSPHSHSHGHSHGVDNQDSHSHGHGHSHSHYDDHRHSHGHENQEHSVHSHDSHSHDDHGHSHGHHPHIENSPHHSQEEVAEQPAVIENIIDESLERKPGFLGGLFKTIFGDKKESVENLRENEPIVSSNVDEGFCEKIDSENCLQSLTSQAKFTKEETLVSRKTFDQYLSMFLEEALQRMDLIISLGLTSLTTLIFVFGYYFINRARKEGPLINKVNELERYLMACSKENEMLKGDIVNTKQKLTSIEDNSFGSNDMVIALKKELEDSEQIKVEMADKISSLEKELEAAAEDGLELNKMVSELLSNQNGSDSIISSVEDLQQQLNEQQDTIITMNETLAAKSRENTELQIQLAEFNNKTLKDVETYQQEFDAIVLERSNLQVELENLKRDSDFQVNQIIEERNSEVTRLNSELTSYAGKFEETKKLLNSSEARVQALEEVLNTLKKNKGDLKNILDVADLKADLLAVTKEKSTLHEQLQTEGDARKLLEDRVKIVSDEMSSLKKEFGVAEKEKLEAQTRLDVLSAYFKETEMRLQLELSEEKARAMKQQGETTSTVEKVQGLNGEIQALKSQNDSLRAEIEAQVAAHKLNISSIEAQAHNAWLNARQAERKLEESRMEAAALRRRLTSIAENPSGANDLLNGMPPVHNDSLNNVPSPMRVESPNMTSMPPMPSMPGVMSSQPPMMMPPPPFMPGFLPPFMPPGEMMPPLGRLMSPPPKRFTPTMRDERDRYSPRRSGRYSPDSRYDDYTAFETETDYADSPPPSPRRSYNSPSDRSKKSKGGHSSGSADSNQQRRKK